MVNALNGILLMPFLFGLQSFLQLLMKFHHELDRLAKSTHGLTGQYCASERMVVHPKGEVWALVAWHKDSWRLHHGSKGSFYSLREERNVTFYSPSWASERCIGRNTTHCDQRMIRTSLQRRHGRDSAPLKLISGRK